MPRTDRRNRAGRCDIPKGVNLALDTLEKRKSVYSDVGVLYYQPWVVLMTDGQPNGDPAVLDRAVQRVTDLVAARKLTVFPSASAPTRTSMS